MAKNRTAEEKRFGRELTERERAAAKVGADFLEDDPAGPEPVSPPAPAPAPARRGVYRASCPPYQRLLIDTGLPAGPEAEAVARAEYRARLGLRRPEMVPNLELV